MDQATKAEQFAALHRKGNPVIIYNAWDAGSAKAIAESGAKAIATGDHPVGFSHGFTEDDFDGFTFDTYYQTIQEISRRVGELPFSVDISNAEGLDHEGLKKRISLVLDTGVVGVNFEDRLSDDSGVLSIEEHCKRIAAIRSAADNFGVPLFINARTDLFFLADNRDHESLMDEALERQKAYQKAGANGFFAPKLLDINLIQQLSEASTLPVNILRLPGAPSTAELRDAGVSRISYGPVVQMEMIEWLKGKAKEAFDR
ncbi:isocitrate lyase/phosphoenolpyruvate mutase family protein [Candidatus Saccharibacteria bacterium]|nr:isocitrate lyase/phosphoenolpyruvate mutase family protein [Candidatus Saccharibacteria bacterium]